MNLICTGRLAKKPYVSQAFQLEIYSGEELCYFLYHNPMFVEEGFLNDTLIAFIRDELGLPDSAEKLSRFVNTKDLTVQMMAVQREFGYYPEERLREFQKNLEAEARKVPFLRELGRADAVLERCRYRMAIRLYEELLGRGNVPGRTRETCAHACRGRAFAYARMGFFEKAVACLGEANAYQPDPETVKLGFKMSRLGGLEPEEWITAEQDRFPDWEKEYMREQDKALARVGEGPLGEIHGLTVRKKPEALKRYLAGKKDEYRKGNDSEGTE